MSYRAGRHRGRIIQLGHHSGIRALVIYQMYPIQVLTNHKKKKKEQSKKEEGGREVSEMVRNPLDKSLTFKGCGYQRH